MHCDLYSISGTKLKCRICRRVIFERAAPEIVVVMCKSGGKPRTPEAIAEQKAQAEKQQAEAVEIGESLGWTAKDHLCKRLIYR